MVIKQFIPEVVNIKTTKEKANIMLAIRLLINEWLEYTNSFKNECAYTDNILELIQNKANELE